MILDILDNSELYLPLNPNLAGAFEFLRRPGLTELEPGRHEVGADIYAMMAKGKGRKPEDALIETHDRYLDLQYVISGMDTMGWKPRRDLGPAVHAPDPRGDVAFYRDEPTVWTRVSPGMFIIFFPEDAHMPLISDGEIHKVIMKVRV